MTDPVMSVRRTTLIGAVLVALGPTSMALYTPAMPQLVEAFATTPAVVKMTLTAYFAGFAFSQLVAGPVADAYGRRLSSLLFIAIYILGSVGAALAQTVDLLIVARLVQGVGAAIGITISRAIVRDLYPGDRGARILNLIGIILAIAPAMSPAIGGITIAIAGWHAVFVLMILLGLASGSTALFALKETIVPDPSRLRPVAIGRAYASILKNREFVSATAVVAGGIGTFFAMAPMLPFALIDTVGLTPTEFGFAMLFQSGTFLAGSLAFRLLMRWLTPRQLVVPGLGFIVAGSISLAIAPHLLGASLLTIMLPVALIAFGIGLKMPFMMMAGLRPFPHIAGQAAAMTGFLQIGAGLVGATVGGWVGSPVLAVSTVIPAMGLIAATAYFVYRRESAKALRMENGAAAAPVPAE